MTSAGPRPWGSVHARRLGLGLLVLVAGCQPTLDLGSNGASLALSTTSVVVPQDGSPTPPLVVTLEGDATRDVLTFAGLPPGIVPTVATDPTTNTASITFTTSPAVAAGDYQAWIGAVAQPGGGRSAQAQALTVTVALAVTVADAPDLTLGVGGVLEEFMSTSFQPAPWQSQFFVLHPDTSDLAALQSQNIHVQIYDPPWDGNPADAWDFTEVDAIVQPLLGVGDTHPMLQINSAPPQIDPVANAGAFADYCAELVQYYNTGGFTWNGQTVAPPNAATLQAASTPPIVWWGIFGDSNLTLSGSQYAQVYAAAATAMLVVDPRIRFSAAEFADNTSTESSTVMGPKAFFPDFLTTLSTLSPGLAQRLADGSDVLSVHMYSALTSDVGDEQAFGTIPGFAEDLRVLTALSDLPSASVWVTQSNVDADFPVQETADGGFFSNNSQVAKPFVLDPRGTSDFFAAWRPYLFSALGKAGNRALYHWDYTSGHYLGPSLDQQNSEVDYDTGSKYLSYWVDYWLGRMFPATGSSGPEILQMCVDCGADAGEAASSASVELLATKNDDGSVVVMFVDFAISPEDTATGAGPSDARADTGSASSTTGPDREPRTAVVDVSQLGAFSSSQTITIDYRLSDLVDGPTPAAASPPSDGKLVMSLPGYGVQFVKLVP